VLPGCRLLTPASTPGETLHPTCLGLNQPAAVPWDQMRGSWPQHTHLSCHNALCVHTCHEKVCWAHATYESHTRYLLNYYFSAVIPTHCTRCPCIHDSFHELEAIQVLCWLHIVLLLSGLSVLSTIPSQPGLTALNPKHPGTPTTTCICTPIPVWT